MDTIDRLAEVRKELRLNQGEFAAKLGLSQAAVSDFENRKKALIDRNLKLICLTFGVNEAWLRTGDGEMFDKKPDPPPQKAQISYDGLDLTPDEKELLDIYDQLFEGTKKDIRKHISDLLELQELRKQTAEKKAEENAG
jgi:transcriptional regulator with XRE-family HTH domain